MYYNTVNCSVHYSCEQITSLDIEPFSIQLNRSIGPLSCHFAMDIVGIVIRCAKGTKIFSVFISIIVSVKPR